MGLPVDAVGDSRRGVVRASADFAEPPSRRSALRLGSHPLLRAAASHPPPGALRPRALAPQQVVGAALVLVGVVVMMLGWWGMSGTEDLLHQFSYLMSGGVIGVAVVAVGLTVLLGYEHARDRAGLTEVLARLDEIEAQVASFAGRAGTDSGRKGGAGAGSPGAGSNGTKIRSRARRPSA